MTQNTTKHLISGVLDWPSQSEDFHVVKKPQYIQKFKEHFGDITGLIVIASNGYLLFSVKLQYCSNTFD